MPTTDHAAAIHACCEDVKRIPSRRAPEWFWAIDNATMNRIREHADALAAEKAALQKYARTMEQWILAQDLYDTIGHADILKQWRKDAGITKE